MKTANEAKKESQSNNNETEKALNTLLSYFETKVAEATAQGKFGLEPLKLMKSQLPANVLIDLEKKLKALGYKFTTTYHNAEQTYSITLTW